MNVLATTGAAALVTAFAASLFAVGASVYGHRARRAQLMRAGQRAILVAAMFTTAAVITLAAALLGDDFSLAYVARVSSTEMLPYMKWAALYGSQAGSLLFWTWVTALLLAALTVVTLPRIPWAAAPATAVAGSVLAAFLFALVFLASPFETSAFDAAEGVGLNPLLVDKGMLIHPPMLLAGLASTAVPFVLGAAALLSGRIDTAWLRAARPWALLSWLVLSAGNFLGAWWAYYVLGWGGYWGWDPVENSALLPLLPLTAFLHSMIVQERRGMLKVWNLALVLASFALAVFGTFNVRSGLVNSVHSFAQSSVGPYFLVLLGATIAASVVLLAWRAPRMRAEHDFQSLLSRESTLVVNNYVLLATGLVVLGATLFPVFSELLQGTRITVGPPFYNDAVGPLLIVLIALIAAGTVLPWRRAANATLARRFRAPLLVAAASAGALAVLGVRDGFALAAIASAVALGYATLREFALGARGMRRASGRGWPASLGGLFGRDRRRYGGYVVHLGLAVMAVAVVGSNVYQQGAGAALAPGESLTVGHHTLTYQGLSERTGTANGVEQDVIASVTVSRGDRVDRRLEPGRRFFRNFPDQPTALVAIDQRLFEDLYVFVQGWDESGVAEIQAFVNPLMLWLWLGAALYIAGGVVAFAPVRAPQPVPRDVPVPGPVQRA